MYLAILKTMEKILNYADKRQTAGCVYCGSIEKTAEHLPPKIFLDEPYPLNLVTIKACKRCNESFSIDEEFVACYVEYLNSNGDLTLIKRPKIQRILTKKPSIFNAFKKIEETEVNERLGRVFLKIAQGHALFEQNELKFEDDLFKIRFGKYDELTEQARLELETIPHALILPEVGSRATQRLLTTPIMNVPWITIQDGNYRYLVFDGGVRMVLSESFWSEILWE